VVVIGASFVGLGISSTNSLPVASPAIKVRQ
jgi:hypothetical protein